MKHTIIMLVLAATTLIACGKKKEADTGTTTGSATAVGSGSDSGSGSATAADNTATGSAATAAVDVPTEVDFEDQASTDITDKNVEAKVKELETDLAP